VRNARDGKLWASFPVAMDAKADGEAPATWVRVALFGDAVAALAPRLTNGTEVYCEGAPEPRDVDGPATVKRGRGSTSRYGRSSRWGRSEGGSPRLGRAMTGRGAV
jgi:hypothetical protein